MNENKEVLLEVNELSQYFKLGRRTLKAVDHVSFDIKKGEVFGLVGESGCGKTTTGRTIIKIYEPSTGDVYFKGHRIVAGTLDYKHAIKNEKTECAAKVAQLKEKGNFDQIKDVKKASSETIAELKKQIKKANHDQKKCDADYIDRKSVV